METETFLGALSGMGIQMIFIKNGVFATVLKNDETLALVVDHLWYKMSEKLMTKETRYDNDIGIESDFFTIILDKNTDNPTKFYFERPRV